MSNPLSLGKARCSNTTAKAICVVLDVDGKNAKRKWIPQDAIHDDSEVYQAGDWGNLVVKDGHWWTRQEGLCD